MTPDTVPAEAPELDDVTLARAQRGDAQAFRELVGRYQRPVYSLIFRLLDPAGKGALVEDLAQETFLRVFHALPRFSPTGPARLSTWILTIATRLALNELRRRTPRSLPLLRAERTVPAAQRPDADLMSRSAGEGVRRAIAGLSAEQRAVLVLREYHEMEYQDIAAALGLDLGTVKSRLARARAALKEALREVEDD